MSRRPRASSTEPENANLLLLDEETAVLVVRGACHVRTASGKLERVSAGGMVVRNARHERDRRITRALELLQATPEKRWTVERLARAVGLSRAVFARRFSEQTGTSPLRHLTELRLALAATVLTDEPEVALGELASRVGYASEFALSRAFKRRFGMAPGIFRRSAMQAVTRIIALAA